MSAKTFHYEKIFRLESGQELTDLQIAYHTYGKLNHAKNNVIWVCHALTADSDVFGWWKGLFGNKDLFNPDDHFIICANILGSCYGSTGPLSIDQHSGAPRYQYFPAVTVKDMVNAHKILADHLGIDDI